MNENQCAFDAMQSSQCSPLPGYVSKNIIVLFHDVYFCDQFFDLKIRIDVFLIMIYNKTKKFKCQVFFYDFLKN